MSRLANSSQISLCIPRWVRRDVNSGGCLSSYGAKQVELHADGAILEHTSDSLEAFQGPQLWDDGLVICVLARASKLTRVVQHLPALAIDHMALFAGHLTPVFTSRPDRFAPALGVSQTFNA